MKTLAYVRHGKKDKRFKNSDSITPKCLRNIKINGILGVNELLPSAKRLVIHLGTEWKRTRQVARAFQKYAESKGYKVALILPRSKRLGSVAMFTRIGTPEYLKADKIKGGLHPLHRVTAISDATYFERLQREILQAVKDIFTCLEDGDLCVTVGHTPLIELATVQIDATLYDIALKELEGVVITGDVNNMKIAKVIQQ
ncbi:MAG: hypothetical protein WC545_03590 [Patescibacteria group bacterium]